jgi:hypothetical protein
VEPENRKQRIVLRAMIAREQLHTEQHQSVPESRITQTYHSNRQTRNPKTNEIPENWVISCWGLWFRGGRFGEQHQYHPKPKKTSLKPETRNPKPETAWRPKIQSTKHETASNTGTFRNYPNLKVTRIPQPETRSGEI